MSADELGSGVDDNIGTVFDGPQQEGRREGIVDHQRNPVPMGDVRNGFDIDEVGIRVAEGFDENQFGLGPDGLLEIRQVGRVHESGRHPVGDQCVLEQVIRAAIDGLGRYDMVPRAGDVQDGVCDGGRAGSDGQGAHASFQGGDPLLQDVLRGVRQAAVDIAGISEAETRGGVFGIMEDIGGSEVDGDGAGVGCRIRMLLTHMELKGFEVEFVRAHNQFVFSVCKGRACRHFKQENTKISRNPLKISIFVEESIIRISLTSF